MQQTTKNNTLFSTVAESQADTTEKRKKKGEYFRIFGSEYFGASLSPNSLEREAMPTVPLLAPKDYVTTSRASDVPRSLHFLFLRTRHKLIFEKKLEFYFIPLKGTSSVSFSQNPEMRFFLLCWIFTQGIKSDKPLNMWLVLRQLAYADCSQRAFKVQMVNTTITVVGLWGVSGFPAGSPENGNPLQSEGRGPERLPPYFAGFYNSSRLSRLETGAGPSLRVAPDKSLAIVADVAPSSTRANGSANVPVTVMRPSDTDEAFQRETELMNREQGCRRFCGDHGHCDSVSFFCLCEPFWTQNPFRTHYHRFETNCGK